jgi:hypothetical protein
MIEQNAAENEFLPFGWIFTRNNTGSMVKFQKLFQTSSGSINYNLRFIMKRIKQFQYRFKEQQRLKKIDYYNMPPVLVYSAPKTGTETITKSLKNIGLSNPIYKVHVLSKQGIYRNERWLKRNSPYSMTTNLIIFSKLLSTQIDKHKNTAEWKIITSAREPVGRIVSSCFQALEKGRLPQLVDDQGILSHSITIQYLKTKLNDYLVESSEDRFWWFDNELKKVFNVDLIKNPFEHRNGYIIVKNQNVSVLVFRLDKINACFGDAISQFYGLKEPVHLISTNIRKEKQFSGDYDKIKDHIKIPQKLCRSIYDTKYAKYFFTEDERERMTKKWSL